MKPTIRTSVAGQRFAALAGRGFHRMEPCLLTLILACAGFCHTALGQANYSVVASFEPPNFYSASPNGLVQAKDGRIYGTTYLGGTGNEGAIYLVENGTLALGYSFQPSPAASGPLGNLTQGTDGALYGTTGQGGAAGAGTLFKWSANGFQVLYELSSLPGEGAYPFAGLFEGSDGVFYGTTYEGGVNDKGTAFRWTPAGLTVLHSFGAQPGDGENPTAPLVEGAPGVLYGTTLGGGAGGGTLFMLDTNGNYQVLHAFNGNETAGDGMMPFAGLVKAPDGALYGTTAFGGNNNMGTIYKLDSNGYSVVYHFSGTDGATPIAGLTVGANDALFGTASAGGSEGLGVVYQFDGQAVNVLHHFTGTSIGGDGAEPTTELLQAQDGSLYGTTSGGGSSSNGIVFRISWAMSQLTIACSDVAAQSCSSTEATLVTLPVHVSDSGGSALVVTWDVDDTTIAMPASGSTTDAIVNFTHAFLPGTHPVQITVASDTDTASCQATITVAGDTTPPELGPVPVAGPFVLGSGSQTVGPIEASASCGLDLDKSVLSATVDTSSVGTKTVTFQAVDNSGNTATKTGEYQVVYAPAGICLGEPTRQVLSPVNADGSSVFNPGRTVPIKFRVADAKGVSIGTPGVVSDFRLVQIMNSSGVQEVNQVPLSGTPSTTFRWDAGARQWTFQLNTRPLITAGTYVYRISLNDGTWIEFQLNLYGSPSNFEKTR